MQFSIKLLKDTVFKFPYLSTGKAQIIGIAWHGYCSVFCVLCVHLYPFLIFWLNTLHQYINIFMKPGTCLSRCVMASLISVQSFFTKINIWYCSSRGEKTKNDSPSSENHKDCRSLRTCLDNSTVAKTTIWLRTARTKGVSKKQREPLRGSWSEKWERLMKRWADVLWVYLLVVARLSANTWVELLVRVFLAERWVTWWRRAENSE